MPENNFAFEELGDSIDDLFADIEIDDLLSDDKFAGLLITDGDGRVNEDFHALLREIVRRKYGKLVGFIVPEGGYEEFSPDVLVWRSIEIEIGSDGLRLVYTQKSKDGLEAPETYNDLKRILKEFESGDNTEIERTDRNWIPSEPDSTSLAINLQERAVVALTLPEGSAFQFNRKGAPISCAYKQKGVFNEVGRLSHTGVLEPSSSIDKEKIWDGCRTAYFLVDGAPNTAIPFNIHVDLICEHETQEDGEAHIPIIIDPVVRHPGGNQ